MTCFMEGNIVSSLSESNGLAESGRQCGGGGTGARPGRVASDERTRLNERPPLDERPLYDVTLSYEDNYARGPFGRFAVPCHDPEACSSSVRHDVLGMSVGVPFGIPAGPLLNSRFTTAAFRRGYDLAVYKTVRSRSWPCNPFPNVVAVHPRSADGRLDPRSGESDDGVLADGNFTDPPSISNSFGVPSRDPDVWQPDMREAILAAGPGQLLIPSFQGSRVPGMGTAAYVDDHVAAARMVCETGAGLMEINTSCPNEGRDRLLCHDPRLVGEIAQAVKNEIGDRPLLIKLGFLADDSLLEEMVDRTVARGLAQGLCAINTLSARLVDSHGHQALPGKGREHSGVCGAAIRDAGLDMVRRLSAIRERRGIDFTIVGVGGVAGVDDYRAYRSCGADVVMSATGAMWNPDLAMEVRAFESSHE